MESKENVRKPRRKTARPGAGTQVDAKPSSSTGSRRKTHLTPLNVKDDQPPSTSEAIDDYFMKRTARTSKRTLNDLRADTENGLPEPRVFEDLLLSYRHPSTDALEKHLHSVGDRLLPNLRACLDVGFNVLLYGVGSKQKLLRRFQSEYLEGYDCLIIPAYSIGITIRKIINTIIDQILPLEIVPTNMNARLEAVMERYSKDEAAESPLYLLINSIDGPNLRNAAAQAVLARLAALPHIHILATIDNVNTPLLWSQAEVSRFNWVWEDCSSLLPFHSEARFTSSRFLQRVLRDPNDAGSRANPLSGLHHIWASVTQNARDIFRLIVEHQLEGMREPLPVSGKKGTVTGASQKKGKAVTEASEGPKGMPLEELYWRCRDAFLATTEVTLRAQLTEFKDHKYIKFTKDADGAEIVYVPLDRASLTKVLENKELFP